MAKSQTDDAIAEALGRSREAVNKKRGSLKIPPYLPAETEAAESESIAETAIPVTVAPVVLPRPEFGALPLNQIGDGPWATVGLVADTHLCCKEERLAELHQQYDIFVREGITQVFHAGNIVDGYIPRINGGSVYESSIDGQAQYVIDNYPSRPGITTFFITGDDHEGWYMKEGFNFGGYLQYLAHDQRRTDLQYIGHVEADIAYTVRGAAKPTMIKIQHPGGGSAYARSYTGQKQVEAFEGGEKPSILVQGHYHVHNYMHDRNIHVVSLPGFQDQTIFARKKRLRMEVGGAFIRFQVNPDDGSVTRFQIEFNRYFTRSYYKRYITSDHKILKGELVLSN
jgi:hypothetical protein